MIQKLTHAQIVDRQVELSRETRVPLVVVLDNIRSLNNVGAMFRSADGAGIEKMFLCGITGYPPQGGIAKTALGAEESVAWEYKKDVLEVVQNLKTNGYKIFALEQTEGAVAYDAFLPTRTDKIALIVGNEVDGVSAALMPLVDQAIEIPMRGVKNSLNVAVAFGVVVFYLSRNLEKEASGRRC